MDGQLELFRLPSVSGKRQAQRQHIILAGRIIAFGLHRDRRRLTMRIDERGLSVGAPRCIGLAGIEAFIRQHASWVLEKLDELSGRTEARHLTIREGACLPVLGKDVSLHVIPGNNRAYWENEILWLAARPNSDLASLARRALQRRALEYFRPRLAKASACLGRPMPALTLSSARTRWGSCSAASGIRLNWRMIHLPSAPIDYVIAHETAHLVEMNHSQRFWNVVEQLFPDWRAARDELKRLGPMLPLI